MTMSAMRKGFHAPEGTATIGGMEYRFKAGLQAYMGLAEMAAQEDERLAAGETARWHTTPAVGDDGEPGRRLLMSPDNAAEYLHAFCVGSTDGGPPPLVRQWRELLEECHPLEVLDAWGVCNQLLEQAAPDWDTESEGATFRRP